MGQLTQFFQPPLYWQQFEELTKRLVEEIYRTQATIYGSAGQAQNGVDVYARTRQVGHLGVQCKRLADLDENNKPLPGGAIKPKMLLSEAKKSLGFTTKLDTWVLATTARRDATAQKACITLNKQRQATGVSGVVSLWFWDDYISWLNALPDLQHWYYDQVIQVRSNRDQDLLLLDLFALAFHRPAFEVPIQSEGADDFLQALQDTQRALRTGELVDRVSRNVIRKGSGGWRDLDDKMWRDELAQIDRTLRSLRADLFAGLKSGAVVRHAFGLEIQDPSVEFVLEERRAECMERLNMVLKDAGLQPTS